MDKYIVSELIKKNPKFSDAYFHNCFFNKITVLLEKRDMDEEDVLEILLEICNEVDRLKKENLDLRFFINMIASKIEENVGEDRKGYVIAKPFTEEDFKIILTNMNGGSNE